MAADFFSQWLPQFLPQCCDAVLYLIQGETCASTNECYDQLRPLGAQLWFSLPYRFGLPAESLMIVHWMMLIVSIVLSVKAMNTLTKPASNNKYQTLFFLAGSTLAHLVFFWPVMQLALTDAPAALFALIAIWLLLMETGHRNFVLALAGLFLGFSAWIRFAYFYPLLGMMAIYILFWLSRKHRQRGELFLLTVLIPIILQYSATFLHHGTFGFLGPRAALGLSAEHSLSIAAGQETILPQQQYLWPTNCEHKIGMEQALQEKDFSTVICLMANRFYFAFGSYSPETYMFAATNLLTHSAIEHVGLDSRWHYWQDNGIVRTSGTALTPDGTQQPFNEKLIAFAEPHQQDRTISAEKRLPLGLPYTFSVWLWSPNNDTIDLILRLPKHHAEGKSIEVARATVTMTSQPTRFSVTGTPEKSPVSNLLSNYGDLEVAIGSTQDHPNSFADRPMAEFYAWGAQLEQSPVMTEYQNPEANITRTDFRAWSPYFLIANIIAMLSVLILSFMSRKTLTHLQIVAAVLMALIVGEIIVTQPEQRFVNAVEVYIWIYFILLIYQKLFYTLFIARTQQPIA